MGLVIAGMFIGLLLGGCIGLTIMAIIVGGRDD